MWTEHVSSLNGKVAILVLQDTNLVGMDILRLEWFDVPFKVSTSDNHNNIATKSQPVHTYTEFMC